jgi:hypothetical protein
MKPISNQFVPGNVASKTRFSFQRSRFGCCSLFHLVAFTMTAAQIIDGKQLPPKPAYRLSVWKKGAGGWQWISHANLASILGKRSRS